MIETIVERTNKQMQKVVNDADKFSFNFSYLNEEELQCLFELLFFQGLYQQTNYVMA